MGAILQQKLNKEVKVLVEIDEYICEGELMEKLFKFIEHTKYYVMF